MRSREEGDECLEAINLKDLATASKHRLYLHWDFANISLVPMVNCSKFFLCLHWETTLCLVIQPIQKMRLKNSVFETLLSCVKSEEKQGIWRRRRRIKGGNSGVGHWQKRQSQSLMKKFYCFWHRITRRTDKIGI